VKILDKYLLKTFVITFTTVFVILFFIFILQTVWLFISELAGKDLDLVLIVKFLMFAMPRIIPLVLPLSVLLASIMTFGNLAENYEFAAMKSSGISLRRAMQSLTVFILIMSFAAFFFANNVIPYAEYKFINFRRDIAQKTPAMAIAEGRFSDLGTYNIKVDKKSGEQGNHLTGVTIHKKAADGTGTSTVIKSVEGDLVSNEASNILQLVLKNGNYYEDISPKKYEERQKLPFAKSSFGRYVINLDLSKLNKVEENSEEIANTNTMLNINELRYTLDSLDRTYEKDLRSFADNIYQRTGIVNYNKPTTAPRMDVRKKMLAKGFDVDSVGTAKLDVEVKDSVIHTKSTSNAPVPADLLAYYPEAQRAAILKIASSNLESTKFSIDGSRLEMAEKLKNINNHRIALHDKFVIAYACILMFFIGAPLGAIIRKGGLGLPIVFSILIFITFHFINTFGKRMAQQDGISPFLGAWMASLILTPLAILLTYRATNDIGLFSMENFTQPFQKAFRKIFPIKKEI
jgi:lipopolysaccharide export system permease protein